MNVMDMKEYFEKNGSVYGVSSKYEFGRWKHELFVFDDYDKATKWLNTETYDFCERELMSKSAAQKLTKIKIA